MYTGGVEENMVQSSMYNQPGILARAFPAPTYLTMPAVGMDMSNYAIKYVSLKRDKGVVALDSYGTVDLPLEVIERGEIKDPETVVKLLSRIREENHFEFMHLALPEEHAYLFQINVPKGSRAEVEQMLEFHLKENVPIAADEALFDFSIFKENKKSYDLNVSVYPTEIASGYIQVLEEARFKVLSIEIEGQATARTLTDPKNDAPVLIIDIGRDSASVSIPRKGDVTFTANIDTGGDHFTRSVARELNISFQEAERLKRKHGFCDIPEGKMVYDGLYPEISKFAEAIRKHLMYWQMHINSGGEEAEEVTKVVIVGGNANIIGLAEFLEATLEVPVEVGDVWKNIFSYETYIPDIHASVSLSYATAVGAALRSIHRSS